MRKFITLILIILVVFYPFIIYFGLKHFNLRYAILSIAFIFLLRLFFIKRTSQQVTGLGLAPLILPLIGLIICILGFIINSPIIIKLYPVLINLLLFSIFSYSLIYPPTIIEKLARLQTKILPKQAIAYTRKVTIAWCIFFILNGSVSLYTLIFSSIEIWALYNGLIAYLLIGLFFVIEYIIRVFVKKHINQSSSI